MKLTGAMLGALIVVGAPSGQPPTGPLQRYDPRLYDFTIDVTLTTAWQLDATQQRTYNLVNAPIVMPIIFQGTFSSVSKDTLRARLWLAGREDTELTSRTRLDDGFPHHTQLAVLTIREFHGKSLRWQLGYRAQVWSSRLRNEDAAAAIGWPNEWPKEVQDGLKPQKYIESDDPFFAQAVEHASEGKLRLVPPYLAAKDLVRYCVNEIRVSGGGLGRGNAGVVHGLQIIGAKRAATEGVGGPHDLVCVCVAMLRAAGIPARPVIGVYEEKQLGRTKFVSWAEFYLPEAGWVPFDPIEMQGKVRSLDVRQAWPEFGTMKDLNRRIPLAYHFMPPAAVQTPQYPSVWGWDPRPGGDPSSQQHIRLSITSRGRGTDDLR